MNPDTVQVRLLGPVDVTIDGRVRPVSGLRRKTVLSVLGLHPGETVSTDRLIDVLWGEHPPTTASNTLQSHISYLRGVLGDRAAIVPRRPGYLLDIPAEATDVVRAQQLVDLADRAADPAAGAAHLRAALDLWRGPSLADVTDVTLLENHANRLDELRLRATQSLIDARMALGEHARLFPELADLAQQHPFDERIHRQLMLALYRTGRHADALAVYQRLRRTIGTELGIDPSPALRDLEAAILRHDPALDPSPPQITTTAGWATPAQLPPTIPAFVGRRTELDQLDALLSKADAAHATGSPTTTIAAVSGSPGVGKTSLVRRWAHQHTQSFPDGQLYLDLRGFSPSSSMVEPAEAVRGFLDAFGLPPQRIPAGLDAQIGLYRSVLAGKRVLIVLDNARDETQVRPLLPGSPGCLVLITSRNRLTGLTATENAHPISVDLLTDNDAHDLLAARLGTDRIAAEPDAVHDIITHCARLPLALAITAAHCAAHPALALTTVTTALHEVTNGLDALDGGDPAADVRTVISWSCDPLGRGAHRLFRLLGLHPGPDITLPAVASLAGITRQQARAELTELHRAHLLTERTPGRHAFHDLLRAFAVELAHTAFTDTEQHTVTHRMLDHYLHSTHAAVLLLDPQWQPLDLTPPQPGVFPDSHTDRDSALAWLTAEHLVLLALTTHAAATGFDTHTWQLASALSPYLVRRGLWSEQVAVQRTALDAARRSGDPVGQARALPALAEAYLRLDGLDDVAQRYRHGPTGFADHPAAGTPHAVP